MNLEQMWAIRNLRDLGFTERDAAFLYLIGSHTGVFTAQHYRTFAGVSRGRPQTVLVDKLTAHGFITRIALSQRDELYHLSGKAFYRAIQNEDSRLRRGMSASLTRQRLQYADFLVQHPGESYLATEQMKFDYFVNELGTDESALPSKVYKSWRSQRETERFFPARFPIYAVNANDRKGVGIVYGEDPVARFEAFKKGVQAMHSLLSEVPVLEFVYVSTSTGRASLATAFLNSLFGDSHAVQTPELLRYFRLRTIVDSGRSSSLSADDLSFWTSAYRRFNKPQYEAMYAEHNGQVSIEALSCARRRREFRCRVFTPSSSLREGL